MAEVLGVSGMAEEEDFFSLGGHSLKANRLVWVLAASHGVDVPLRSVFEERTPLRLARAARRVVSTEEETAPEGRPDAGVTEGATRETRLLALLDEIGATDDDRT